MEITILKTVKRGLPKEVILYINKKIAEQMGIKTSKKYMKLGQICKYIAKLL
jgi:hypothetical protein